MHISTTADRRPIRMEIWDSSIRKCICRVLFMSDFFSSVWGHSVHFAKFPMLRFSKGYYCQFPSNFNQSLWKVWYNQGIPPFILLNRLVKTGIYGATNLTKATPPAFHPSSAKVYEDIAYHHGGIEAATFLGNLRTSCKMLWLFETRE